MQHVIACNCCLLVYIIYIYIYQCLVIDLIDWDIKIYITEAKLIPVVNAGIDATSFNRWPSPTP